MTAARKHVPARWSLTEVHQESGPAFEQGGTVQLTGRPEIGRRSRCERIDYEGQRMYTPVEGDELHPIPDGDLRSEGKHVFPIPTAAELDDLGHIDSHERQLLDRRLCGLAGSSLRLGPAPG